MKKIRLFYAALPVAFLVLALSCQKEISNQQQPQQQSQLKSLQLEQAQQQQIRKDGDNRGVTNPSFNLNVRLYGYGETPENSGDRDHSINHNDGEDSDSHNGEKSGFLKFRQDPDQAKIVTLDIRIRGLEPNHEYLLQRAVDAANVVDGNCTSTSWLTLGKGLTPQSILTNEEGDGSESLWRDISSVPSGTTFDIHFRVVDATTMDVLLNSDCYAYKVR
jgi:hypothetical protein